jgi:hypothetical protein
MYPDNLITVNIVCLLNPLSQRLFGQAGWLYVLYISLLPFLKPLLRWAPENRRALYLLISFRLKERCFSNGAQIYDFKFHISKFLSNFFYFLFQCLEKRATVSHPVFDRL